MQDVPKRHVDIVHLPKIGSEGLAIHASLRTEDWAFHKLVAGYMRRNGIGEAWFQAWNDKEGWLWSHGIVKLEGNRAVITQIG